MGHGDRQAAAAFGPALADQGPPRVSAAGAVSAAGSDAGGGGGGGSTPGPGGGGGGATAAPTRDAVAVDDASVMNLAEAAPLAAGTGPATVAPASAVAAAAPELREQETGSASCAATSPAAPAIAPALPCHVLNEHVPRSRQQLGHRRLGGALEASCCAAAATWLLLDMVAQPDCSLEVFDWLAQGQERQLQQHGPELMCRAAARRDGWHWLRHLRARHGLPWSTACFTAAAGAGASEAQMEWMVGDGCPVPCDGEPYVRAAAASDVAMLHCLRRLRRPPPAPPPAPAAGAGGSGGSGGGCGATDGGAGDGASAAGCCLDEQKKEHCTQTERFAGVPCVPSVLLRAMVAEGGRLVGEEQVPGLQALLDLGLAGPQVDWDQVRQGLELHMQQQRGLPDASRHRVLAWVKAQRKQARREERDRARRRGALERLKLVLRPVLTWARALRRRESSDGRS